MIILSRRKESEAAKKGNDVRLWMQNTNMNIIYVCVLIYTYIYEYMHICINIQHVHTYVCVYTVLHPFFHYTERQ